VLAAYDRLSLEERRVELRFKPSETRKEYAPDVDPETSAKLQEILERENARIRAKREKSRIGAGISRKTWITSGDWISGFPECRVAFAARAGPTTLDLRVRRSAGRVRPARAGPTTLDLRGTPECTSRERRSASATGPRSTGSATGDRRSAANKVRQHGSWSSRHRARGNPQNRVSVADRSRQRTDDIPFSSAASWHLATEPSPSITFSAADILRMRVSASTPPESTRSAGAARCPHYTNMTYFSATAAKDKPIIGRLADQVNKGPRPRLACRASHAAGRFHSIGNQERSSPKSRVLAICWSKNYAGSEWGQV